MDAPHNIGIHDKTYKKTWKSRSRNHRCCVMCQGAGGRCPKCSRRRPFGSGIHRKPLHADVEFQIEGAAGIHMILGALPNACPFQYLDPLKSLTLNSRSEERRGFLLLLGALPNNGSRKRSYNNPKIATGKTLRSTFISRQHSGFVVFLGALSTHILKKKAQLKVDLPTTTTSQC